MSNYNEKTTIQKFEPVITSKYISIYEYAKLLTELSELLYNSTSIGKYINEIEIKAPIDTNKLAYKLLSNGVFDATIDRGYEKVSFSKLKINPLYNKMIEDFLSETEKSMNETFLSVIGL